jgi:hypothetical protein
METRAEPTEFDELFRTLTGLTRAEIAELVIEHIPKRDVASFVQLATGLSIEALRFVSARALLRAPHRDIGGRKP